MLIFFIECQHLPVALLTHSLEFIRGHFNTLSQAYTGSFVPHRRLIPQVNIADWNKLSQKIQLLHLNRKSLGYVITKFQHFAIIALQLLHIFSCRIFCQILFYGHHIQVLHVSFHPTTDIFISILHMVLQNSRVPVAQWLKWLKLRNISTSQYFDG